MNNLQEELSNLDIPISVTSGACNSTEYSIAELEAMQWEPAGKESTIYSALSAVTYVDPTKTLAKKVYSDHYIEYYEIA